MNPILEDLIGILTVVALGGSAAFLAVTTLMFGGETARATVILAAVLGLIGVVVYFATRAGVRAGRRD